MALPPGMRLGSYEVGALIGAGGMGEVYRARDTTLNRDVALKILPDAFARDPERLARFTREAQTLAALNHPYIAQIHGFEQSTSLHALVMELVEGEDLSRRIARGPIPLDEALPLARQVAEALEAAHERGIVHRDLKPANIKVRPDGTVKVLDFGLAKAFDRTSGTGDQASADVMNSPTITSPAMMTGVGVILGTAAYMSPEQAKGKLVDKRTDVWAFGCVLYEMLTGARAFAGEDVSDTLAFILTKEPDTRALPASTPAAIRRLLRRCLEKDRKRRLSDIADARLEIDDALASPAEVTTMLDTAVGGAAPAPRGRARLAWFIAAVFAVSTLGLAAALTLRRAPVDLPVYRSTILVNEDVSRRSAGQRYAISPDGRRLAYVAIDATGRLLLWVRAFEGSAGQPLPGTEGAYAPFWSPDSRHIAFFADGKLKKIDAAGGTPTAIGDVAEVGQRVTAGSWNRDDVIVFPGRHSSGLSRVTAAGGTPSAVTTLDTTAAETVHGYPFFLPDGRHFLYVAYNELVPVGVYVGSLDSGRRVRLMDGASNVQYAQNSVVFVRGTTLMAQRFNPATLAFAGEAVPVGEEVIVNAFSMLAGAFSISNTGALVYQSSSAARNGHLVWSDRGGKQTEVLEERAPYSNLGLSPDGTRASVSLVDPRGGTSDIWVINLKRGLRTRFTFDPADEFVGLWSQDSMDLVFNSRRKGHLDLYRKAASGAGGEELLLADQVDKTPTSWSPDSRFLLYTVTSLRTGADVWVLPLAGERKPFPYVETPFTERFGQFSPDGRSVAYASSESGRDEVYVAPFPGPGGKGQISDAGGRYPRWGRDGKELFYQSLDNKMMVATVSGGGAAGIDVAAVRSLFEMRAPEGLPRTFYDVTGDGQRFLINAPEGQTTDAALTLVTNWPALLKNGR